MAVVVVAGEGGIWKLGGVTKTNVIHTALSFGEIP